MALPIVIRALMGSGPNAENNGEKTLPFLSVPRAAMYSSGTRPSKREYPIAFGDPALRQDIGKPICLRA